MPQIKAPRLYKNRYGVFYFRIKNKTQERRISLKTKCPVTANIIALQLNADFERERAMTKPKISDFSFSLDNVRKSYEFDINAGTFRADTPEDHRNGMEALDKIMAAMEYQRSLSKTREIASAPAETEPVIQKSEKLSVAVDMWLAERAKKNAERTVTAKKYHMEDFCRRMIKGNPEINSINKAIIVRYKDVLLNKEGQTGKTVDNKLLTLMDFFKYVSNHGMYTVSNTNPVDGLFVLTKAERVAKNEPYDAFESEELKTLFEPLAYKEHMNAPDLFWGPLIGIYTGTRISDVAAIHCSDIKKSENGVDYLYIPKSKTNAGKRNVPISDDLINLGFLDYVNEVKQSGAERLFPHRSFVNGTYSKRLSEELLKYQTKRGLKKRGERKSFHSFRVNVITALANNGANTIQVMKIVGHETGEKGIETHLGYIRDLPDLKNIINTLSWGIDIEGLKYHGEFKDFINDKNNWIDLKKKKATTKKTRKAVTS